MTREYYYNPDKNDSVHEREMEFNKNQFNDYLNNHPFMNGILNKCSKESGCRVISLKATLQAIADSTHGFSCTASQKTLAQKAKISVRTLQSCIYILRKNNVLTTKHRYTKGKNKRRTSSKTIIKAFLVFLDKLIYKATQAKNYAMVRGNEIKRFLDRSIQRTSQAVINPCQGHYALKE